jgi:hypothetical protein
MWLIFAEGPRKEHLKHSQAAGSLVLSGSVIHYLERSYFGAVSTPSATTEPRRKSMSGLVF